MGCYGGMGISFPSRGRRIARYRFVNGDPQKIIGTQDGMKPEYRKALDDMMAYVLVMKDHEQTNAVCREAWMAMETYIKLQLETDDDTAV